MSTIEFASGLLIIFGLCGYVAFLCWRGGEPLTIWANVYDECLPNEAGIGVARVHKENVDRTSGGRLTKFVEVPE